MAQMFGGQSASGQPAANPMAEMFGTQAPSQPAHNPMGEMFGSQPANGGMI